MSRKELKQALVSLLIGAGVSFITIILQGLIDILHTIPTQAPGTFAGMATYLSMTVRNRIG